MAPSRTVGRLDYQTIGQLGSVEVHYSTYVRIFADSSATRRIRSFAAPQAAIGVRRTALLWPKCAIVKRPLATEDRFPTLPRLRIGMRPIARPTEHQVESAQSDHPPASTLTAALHDRTFWSGRRRFADTGRSGRARAAIFPQPIPHRQTARQTARAPPLTARPRTASVRRMARHLRIPMR